MLRIGSFFKKNGDNRKSRPIIVTFVRYVDRHNIIFNKTILKGKNISITERLGKERMSKLKRRRSNIVLSKCGPLMEKLYFFSFFVKILKFYYKSQQILFFPLAVIIFLI